MFDTLSMYATTIICVQRKNRDDIKMKSNSTQI